MVVYNHLYHLFKHNKMVVKEELKAMLDMGLIKEFQWLEQQCGFGAQGWPLNIYIFIKGIGKLSGFRHLGMQAQGRVDA